METSDSHSIYNSLISKLVPISEKSPKNLFRVYLSLKFYLKHQKSLFDIEIERLIDEMKETYLIAQFYLHLHEI